jgi:hypothetical protein
MNDTQDVTIDLSRVIDASHENKWVALASDYSRVIASAKTLYELLEKALDENVIYYKVLPRDVSFAPAML